MLRSLASFRKDTQGSATIEFVAVFFFFIAILTFTIEVALYMFFQMTLEKAAETGVRVAVISPAVMALPVEILPNTGSPANGVRGQRCEPDRSASRDPCLPIYPAGRRAQKSCGRPPSDGPCTGAFERIVDEMARFNAGIEPENVRITYTDLGIGFAGGRPVPMVTVTVDGVAFQSAFLGLLLNRPGGPDRASQYQFFPPRSASLTAESLGS